MLTELTVENVAIIERSQLQPGEGFSVLTGETGAGKSLLIDAIELVLGERADTDLVRHGSARASVTAAFDLSAQPDLRKACEDLGFSLENGILIVQRDVYAEGRSQARVGGKLAPLASLRQLGRQLIDLHGQHDHQSLLHEERHLSYLDLWIGAPAETAKAEVFQAFQAFQATRLRLKAAQTGQREREQRLDLLRYQIEEIESVGPLVGEFPELEAQLSRLTHAEKLGQVVGAALDAVFEAEQNAADDVSANLVALEEVSRLDPDLEATLDSLRDAHFALQEARSQLRAYADGLELDPERLEEVAGRLDSLKRLRRKYGDDETAILDYLQEIALERDALEGDQLSEGELQAELEAATESLMQGCKRLTELRRDKATAFAALVQAELLELAMDKAQFGVALRNREPDEDGADEVSFQFSANAGEPPRALSKIASGGELSRVMLSIKSVLAGKAGVPTLIFDEVDAGLSGRAAATVARKLEKLAETYQIIAISHLPQIACRAKRHFRIEKSEINGRVRTEVVPLTQAERTEELARMIAGDVVTDAARLHAQEMLTA